MMIFSLLQYAAVFVLGVVVSVMLSGARDRDDCNAKILAIGCLLLTSQALCFHFLGLDTTKKLYPLMVHLPLWALLVLLLKTPKLQTAVSIMTAYMCCQIPRWIASLGLLIPEEHWLYQILYLPAAGLFLIFLHRYLASSIRQFMERSPSTCLLMGLVPMLYYVFDYATTVFTSLLRSGNMAAVQFIPSVISMAYLIFVCLYNQELEKQVKLARERDFLAVQLQQSKTALSAMQHSQEKTRQYRHDMRHHFTLLQAMAAEHDISKIQQYLSTAQQDMDTLTPKRYCADEVVNLLLSYYTMVAQEQNVEMTVTTPLSGPLSFPETELCSLLSNGLENAIEAASRVKAPGERRVSIRLGIQGGNLLIQIENTYAEEPSWQDGLPCANRKNHGLGTHSIRSIVRSHGGEAIFRTRNGLFQLRILIPRTEPNAQ